MQTGPTLGGETIDRVDLFTDLSNCAGDATDEPIFGPPTQAACALHHTGSAV